MVKHTLKKSQTSKKGGYPLFYDESVLTCARPRIHPRTYNDRLIINPNSLEPEYFSQDPLMLDKSLLDSSLIAYSSSIPIDKPKIKQLKKTKTTNRKKTLKKTRKSKKKP